MLRLKNIVLCIISSMTIGLHAMNADLTKFNKGAVFASHKLGNIDVYHGSDGFYVGKDDKKQKVKPYFIDKTLRSLNKKQIDTLQKNGYIEVKQLSDGEYSLKMNMRGKGGGPITANIFYWVTKSVCYGTASAALTTGVIATGGALAATGGAIGTGIGGSALGTAVSTTITGGVAVSANIATGSAIGTAMGANGAVFVSAALGSSASATATASMATAATVTASGGCIATAMAAVETASLAMSAIGLMLPLP